MSSTETNSLDSGSDDLKVPEKVTLRLAPDARVALDWIAAKRGLTLAEVVRQAISHEKFLTEEIDRGSTILIEGKDGRLKQLVFV
ncbi:MULTISPECIES: hypothetical protein [unclassified Bradyrhizobium]|uniref:hypothetical protein n=1 Tax=unclassified Bradyrhizobium TaxID=2631580 RepID=UPI0028EDC226|nr:MULTISPECIES: hypothetical protein [unclassified Bradyrhizobium]